MESLWISGDACKLTVDRLYGRSRFAQVGCGRPDNYVFRGVKCVILIGGLEDRIAGRVIIERRCVYSDVDTPDGE